MKLLTPQSVKDLKSQDLARGILRAKETEDAIKKINQRRAEAEVSFNSALARNRELWAKEEQDHQKRKTELQFEIDTLEAKRLNALIPINIIKISAEDKMKEATDFLTGLRLRERVVEETTERLEDKLDEVGEREITVKNKEKELLLKQQGIERQEENLRLNNERLTEQMKEHLVLKQNAITNIEERTKEVVLKERSLEAKEQLIQRNLKAIKDKEKQLSDERGTLDRAWKELERMKGISP